MAAREQVIEVLKTHYPFRKMENAVLGQLVDLLQTRDYAEGEVIYNQGDEAEHFYILLSGHVRLTYLAGGREMQFMYLSTGDFFGFEMLATFPEHKLSAVTDGPTTVLYFNRATMEKALAIPIFHQGMSLLYESRNLSLRVPLPWRSPDETIYFIGRRHVMFLFLRMLSAIAVLVLGLPVSLAVSVWLPGLSLGGILLVIVLVVATLLGIWEYIDWANDYSIVTSERVVYQEKVVLLYDSRQEAPLNAVLSVTTESDQFGRWLGYGDVVVRTFAGIIIMPKLQNPQQIVALVEAEWNRARALRTAAERAQIRRMIREKLGLSMATKPDGTAPVPSTIQDGALRKWLSGVARMRFEKGKTITYRTHWIFLLRNTFLPGLCLLALAVVLALNLVQVITVLSPPAMLALVLVAGIICGCWFAYQYFDWVNDYYEVNDDQVVDVYKKPLGREERQAAPLKNIQSIEFKRRGLLGVIFNFGTVYLQVGEARLSFDNVFNPAEVQRELFKRIAERDYKEKQAAEANEQQRMIDWFSLYHDAVEEEQIIRRSQQPPQN